MTGITLVSVSGTSPDGQADYRPSDDANHPRERNRRLHRRATPADDAIGAPCSTVSTTPFSVGATSTSLSVASTTPHAQRDDRADDHTECRASPLR